MKMGFLSKWGRWNTAICDAIEDRLPESFTRSLLHLHELTVAEAVSARPGLRVVDIGGGANTPFATRLTKKNGMWLVGTDILADSLRMNGALDARVASDACGGLPFKDNSIDVVSTRSVMEHLPSNSRFLDDCHRILKPGGLTFCVMPSRRAPFAWLNRLLPEDVKRRLLFTFFPEWREACGFLAHYDHCAWPEMVNCFTTAGFHVNRIEFRYYQSIYFKFFVPLFLISLLYDLIIWMLAERRLCCQMFIVAERN
jgi:SAM-dependent methyltransferase